MNILVQVIVSTDIVVNVNIFLVPCGIVNSDFRFLLGFLSLNVCGLVQDVCYMPVGGCLSFKEFFICLGLIEYFLLCEHLCSLFCLARSQVDHRPLIQLVSDLRIHWLQGSKRLRSFETLLSFVEDLNCIYICAVLQFLLDLLDKLS